MLGLLLHFTAFGVAMVCLFLSFLANTFGLYLDFAELLFGFFCGPHAFSQAFHGHFTCFGAPGGESGEGRSDHATDKEQ